MKSCRSFQGDMAAALYEAVDGPEAVQFRAHLADCPDCASEYSRLQCLVEEIPNSPVEFSGNLLPALHEALREEQAARRVSVWRYVTGVLVFACLTLIGAFVWYGQELADSTDGVVAEVDPIDVVLAEAETLLASDEPVKAKEVLEAAVAELGDVEQSGRLRLELANLEFDRFNRYEEAYSKYKAVRDRLPSTWVQSSGLIKARFDLLTEAQEAGFAPLYEIDAARSQGEAGLGTLEGVLARYPGRAVAGEALTTMASLVEGEGVEVWENLKGRCTNPVAMAQLDIRLGEGYIVERKDPERGRLILEGVAKGPHEAPAKMAAAVLARLEPESR